MTRATPGHAPGSVAPDVLLFHRLHCNVDLDRWWSPVIQYGADRPLYCVSGQVAESRHPVRRR